MRISKYSKAVIKKAIKMRQTGFSPTVIRHELGFTCPEDVYYHTSPGVKKKHIQNMKLWYKKNRSKRLIQMKAYNQRRKL